MDEQVEKSLEKSLLDEPGILSIQRQRSGRKDHISKKAWAEKCLRYLSEMDKRLRECENEVAEMTVEFLLFELEDTSPSN